ncbi:MAG: Txe/YoeB family addiction module toxin [Deltaproteobacteria bacterium]|jgi:toxin YoeB|nr:Txe/YoeB family addiction module toxin [Deltaproteobacteria bacterium]
MADPVWTPNAWKDYVHWQEQDKKKLRRINALITAALRTPSEGEGKPEPLRFQLAGYWSRRIDQEHRLIYAWDETADTLTILHCRYHYDKG